MADHIKWPVFSRLSGTSVAKDRVILLGVSTIFVILVRKTYYAGVYGPIIEVAQGLLSASPLIYCVSTPADTALIVSSLDRLPNETQWPDGAEG